jgi:hypothetical protein
MDITFLMTIVGPVILGLAIAYGLISTRRRRTDPEAQNRTARATEEIYREAERESTRQEQRSRDHQSV